MTNHPLRGVATKGTILIISRYVSAWDLHWKDWPVNNPQSSSCMLTSVRLKKFTGIVEVKNTTKTTLVVWCVNVKQYFLIPGSIQGWICRGLFISCRHPGKLTIGGSRIIACTARSGNLVKIPVTKKLSSTATFHHKRDLFNIFKRNIFLGWMVYVRLKAKKNILKYLLDINQKISKKNIFFN